MSVSRVFWDVQSGVDIYSDGVEATQKKLHILDACAYEISADMICETFYYMSTMRAFYKIK